MRETLIVIVIRQLSFFKIPSVDDVVDDGDPAAVSAAASEIGSLHHLGNGHRGAEHSCVAYCCRSQRCCRWCVEDVAGLRIEAAAGLRVVD